MPKTAGIILVGNEILSGKIADANAAYLCRELRALGVDVRRITVIPDEVHLIAEEVAAFSRAFDVVFTSGGVGPTHDDVTIEGVARAMGAPVVRHPDAGRAPRALLPGHGQRGARCGWPRSPRAPSWSAARRSASRPSSCATSTCCPACPRSSAPKFEALRERFRDQPIHLRTCSSASGRGRWPTTSTGCSADFPLLLLGSYPEFSNPEYKVKVTLESRDRGYVEQALADFLARLPADVGGAGRR